MLRHWLVWLAALLLAPGSASAVSLVVDRLGTPDVVQAGDRVSFSFAFQFDPDEILLATQAEISAPHLDGFTFTKARDPWDLSADFRQMTGGGNPMWVYAEDTYGEDAKGVTWEEVGGLAPLGRFSAIAAYNGEIVFDLSSWELLMLDNTHIPIAAAWEHYRTGVTIVGGAALPPPPPPVEPPPPTVISPPPPPEVIASPPPAQEPPPIPPVVGVFPIGEVDHTLPVPWIGCSEDGACVRLINRMDYEIMLMNMYVPMSQADAASAVPEPRGSALLALGLMLAALGIRRVRSE